MSRETRQRMTEQFVGVRDGTLAAQLGGQKVFGSTGLPDYAVGREAAKTGDDLFRDFEHLVQRRDH